ncbi:MAG: hypothetical protein ACK5Y2_06850 [Bdellovibrionales bacterium]|jgi:Flp pilus assembly pilin Flp
MKNLKEKLKTSRFSKLVKNERGQGMLEYILLVVVIVGLVVIVRRFLPERVEQIRGQIESKIGEVLN